MESKKLILKIFKELVRQFMLTKDYIEDIQASIVHTQMLIKQKII